MNVLLLIVAIVAGLAVALPLAGGPAPCDGCCPPDCCPECPDCPEGCCDECPEGCCDAQAQPRAKD